VQVEDIEDTHISPVAIKRQIYQSWYLSMSEMGLAETIDLFQEDDF
jgi:hypothetical protein